LVGVHDRSKMECWLWKGFGRMIFDGEGHKIMSLWIGFYRSKSLVAGTEETRWVLDRQVATHAALRWRLGNSPIVHPLKRRETSRRGFGYPDSLRTTTLLDLLGYHKSCTRTPVENRMVE